MATSPATGADSPSSLFPKLGPPRTFYMSSLRQSLTLFCQGLEECPDVDAAGIYAKTTARTLRGFIERDKDGAEAQKFVKWWKDDKERRLCTLEQAIGAYISTFPGRLHSLLVELLAPHV